MTANNAQPMGQKQADGLRREWALLFKMGYASQWTPEQKMTRQDGSVFEPIIGNPGDGSSPHLAIVDEYHEHDTAELFDTMQRQPVRFFDENKTGALMSYYTSDIEATNELLQHSITQLAISITSLLGTIGMMLALSMRLFAIMVVLGAIVVLVVQRATLPVRRLSSELQGRGADDLSPIAAPAAPRELQPLIDATNAVMQRLSRLLAHQKRFVRDASHQLRDRKSVV